MCLSCGGIFNYNFIANLLQSLTAENFENLLRFHKVIGISSLPHFFMKQCNCMHITDTFSSSFAHCMLITSCF